MNGNSTRERILQIALHLFAQSGYEAVSVSDIAAQLGITKGALYRHYASKRDIFNSIVSRMAQMDAEQARACALPEGLAAEMPNAYRQASLAQLFAFCRVQFKYWTQAPFPADFRRMLTLEQYRSAEMNRLYQQYLGAGPLDYTADNLDDAELENPVTEALREFWLKHRLTILLTLAVLLAAGMVGLLIGWLIFERRRTKKRKEGFFGADVAVSIDAIFRYMMDVLRARGMAAKNCPPADYVSYMDEDLREEYLAAAKLWQEARFSGRSMQELQRRQVLRLKDEIWERTWHSASLKERLRLKYVEFL